MRLLQDPKGSKLTKILGIKKTSERFWRFLIDVLFPLLCYGCCKPGRALCKDCLGICRRYPMYDHCQCCLRPLVGKTDCSHCPFSCRMIALYTSRKEIVSIYRHAVSGKAIARKLFVRAIRHALVWGELFPKQIILWDAALRDWQTTLTEATGIPCKYTWNRKHVLRYREEALCILSRFPLSETWRVNLEMANRRTVFISLFLPIE